MKFKERQWIIFNTKTGIIINENASNTKIFRIVNDDNFDYCIRVDNQKIGDIVKGYLELKSSLKEMAPLKTSK